MLWYNIIVSVVMTLQWLQLLDWNVLHGFRWYRARPHALVWPKREHWGANICIFSNCWSIPHYFCKMHPKRPPVVRWGCVGWQFSASCDGSTSWRCEFAGEIQQLMPDVLPQHQPIPYHGPEKEFVQIFGARLQPVPRTNLRSLLG